MVNRQYPLKQDVTKGDLLSAYVVAPFDEGLDVLRQNDYKLISSDEQGVLRVQEGYTADVSKFGNWVLQGPLYRKNERTLLLPAGLPLRHPVDAVHAHRNYKEYIPSDDDIQQAIAEGLEVLPKDVDKNGNIVVPFKSIGSDKYGMFFFGEEGTDTEKSKKAQAYGDWIVHQNNPYRIKDFVVLLDNQNYTNEVGTHANQFWLWWLENGSELIGWNWELDYANRVRGVRKNLTEKVEEKN